MLNTTQEPAGGGWAWCEHGVPEELDSERSLAHWWRGGLPWVGPLDPSEGPSFKPKSEYVPDALPQSTACCPQKLDSDVDSVSLSRRVLNK